MVRKQKILIAHNYYQIPGGEDSVVANEKKMLEDNGHEVVLYTRRNDEIKTMNVLRKIVFPISSIFNIKTYFAVKRIIEEQNIDIVHVHNTLAMISPSIYYAGLKCKKPVIQTIHNFRLLCPAATFYRNDHICEDCLEKGLRCAVKHNCYRNSKIQTLLAVINNKFHRATGIYKKITYICLTEFNKEKLLQHGQIKEEQIFVKPNFVQKVGKVVPFNQRPEQYISVGRLEKLKGTDILVKAWEMLGEKAPKLIICGVGEMQKEVEEVIQAKNLNIEYKGFVANHEVRKMIARSKALIMCSQCYEGFPVTIAEAYSMGTPVIGSNMGNVGSLIEDRKTGLKFYFESPEKLGGVIRNMDFKELSSFSEIVDRIFEEKYCENENYSILFNIFGRIT